MENTVEILKRLALAHQIAEAFDYVQESSMAQEIADDYGFGSKEDIEDACEEYEGWSDGDLVSKIISEIKNL